MNSRSTLFAIASATTLTFTLAACGGGGSALSRSDLASKANAICQSENNKADAVDQPSDITDATQAAAYFDKILPIFTDGTNSLKDLKADDDAKADWATFISAREKAQTLLQTITDKADNKDASGLDDIKQEPAIQAAFKAAATKIGANTCGT